MDEEGIHKELMTIWKDVLRVDVGPDADFFDLGGDSITAFDVLTRIFESFGVELGIQSIYTHTTVRQLAAEVSRAKASA